MGKYLRNIWFSLGGYLSALTLKDPFGSWSGGRTNLEQWIRKIYWRSEVTFSHFWTLKNGNRIKITILCITFNFSLKSQSNGKFKKISNLGNHCMLRFTSSLMECTLQLFSCLYQWWMKYTLSVVSTNLVEKSWWGSKLSKPCHCASLYLWNVFAALHFRSL